MEFSTYCNGATTRDLLHRCRQLGITPEDFISLCIEHELHTLDMNDRAVVSES